MSTPESEKAICNCGEFFLSGLHHSECRVFKASPSMPSPATLAETLKDIIAVYEWCCVDPVDRGYSALDSEIHRAKHLLADGSDQ
jgi:hypothetical protein